MFDFIQAKCEENPVATGIIGGLLLFPAIRIYCILILEGHELLVAYGMVSS